MMDFFEASKAMCDVWERVKELDFVAVASICMTVIDQKAIEEGIDWEQVEANLIDTMKTVHRMEELN